MEQLPDEMQMMLGSTQSRSVKDDETFDKNSDIFNDLTRIPSIKKCKNDTAISDDLKLSNYKKEEAASLKNDKNYKRFRTFSDNLKRYLNNNSFADYEEDINNETERIIPLMEKLAAAHKAPYSVCETAKMIMYISARRGNAETEKFVTSIYNDIISSCAAEADIFTHIDAAMQKVDIPGNEKPTLTQLADAAELRSSEAETADMNDTESIDAPIRNVNASKAVKPVLKGIDELAAGYKYDEAENVQEIVVKKRKTDTHQDGNKSVINSTAPQKENISANVGAEPSIADVCDKAAEPVNAYVSFCRDDRKVADRLCELLEKKGISCLCDDIVPMDDKWFEPIAKKIRSADAFIVVYSSDWPMSNYLKDELILAKKHNIPIVTFKIDNSTVSDYSLSDAPLISADVAHNDYKINELCKTVIDSQCRSAKSSAVPPQKNGEYYFHLGVRFYKEGKKYEAEKNYRLAIDKGYVKAQYKLGCLLSEFGRKAEAEKYYRMAADNGDAKAQKALNALLEKNKEKPSLDSIMAEKASDNDKEKTNNSAPKGEIDKLRSAADNDNVYAQNNYGELLEALGKTEEAERYYRMAADKGHKAAQSNLGSLLFKQGRNDEAEKYLLLAADNVHTTSRDDNKALSEKNEKETLHEDEEKSTSPTLEELSQPILNSKEIAEQYKLGIQYELIGKNDEAIKCYRLAADNGYVTAQYNLGCLLNKLGRTDDAIKYYSMAANNRDETAQYSLGFLFEEMDKKEDAEKYYRMAADNWDVTAQFTLIALLDELGKKDEAEEYLRVVAENDVSTEHFTLEGQLVKLCMKSEQYYRFAANKGNVVAQKYLGYILEHTDRRDEAEIYYRSAADNGNIYAQRRYAYILESSGRAEEAEKYYRLAADNGNAAAQNNLGCIYDKAGKKDEAERYFRLAADNGHATAQCNLGLLLEELGKDEAENYYRLSLGNGYAKALKYLSDLLKKKGKTTGAEKYLLSSTFESKRFSVQKAEEQAGIIFNMSEEQLSCIFNKIMEEYSPLHFVYAVGSDTFRKEIIKATAAYAEIKADEKALIMSDTSLFRNAKEGFVMTNKSFYIKRMSMSTACIPISGITGIHIFRNEHNVYYIVLIYDNREQVLTYESSEVNIYMIFSFISNTIKQIKSGDFVEK